MVLVLDCLEEQFLEVFLVVEVEVMVVEDEEGKRMALILSFLVLFLVEGQEDAIVEGRKDKLQGKSWAQSSLD